MLILDSPNYDSPCKKIFSTIEISMLGGLDTQRQLNPKLGDCSRSKVIFE